MGSFLCLTIGCVLFAGRYQGIDSKKHVLIDGMSFVSDLIRSRVSKYDKVQTCKQACYQLDPRVVFKFVVSKIKKK